MTKDGRDGLEGIEHDFTEFLEAAREDLEPEDPA